MGTSDIKDSYKSIATESRGLFKDNGSRFIAHAYPVETEEEVKEIVAALKKEYYDARHHVYAYRLGYLGDKFRANDDGEPSGSSGRPVLGQIDSCGLSDILVVVVRYFGARNSRPYQGIQDLDRRRIGKCGDSREDCGKDVPCALRLSQHERSDEGHEGHGPRAEEPEVRHGMQPGYQRETFPCGHIPGKDGRCGRMQC